VAKPARIGIYGGTFDPIHNRHVAIARAARAHAHLDQVLFVVSAIPPHKQGDVHASAEDRYACVAAALEDEDGLAPSRIEIDRAGPSYTADTLAALQDANPDANLVLILGADAVLDLPKWRNPEAILARAQLLAVPRPGWDATKTQGIPVDFDLLPIGEDPMSSTEVRARVRRGEPLDDFVPPGAARIIKERGLYRAPADTAPG